MGRGGARPSALNVGQGPQTAGLIDPLGIWGPAETPFVFDLNAITFTARMAKRNGQAAFAAAIMGPQGRWDGTGAPDVITIPRGAQLGNPTGRLYANYDPYQGSVVFWITPEWDGDDGLDHNIILPCVTGIQYLVKHSSSVLRAYYGGGFSEVNVAAWTAGTTYFVVFRWDSKRTLDGTNYCCWSLNNVHTFGRTSYTADEVPLAVIPFGVSAAYTNASNALIEGFTVYRRPLTASDGTGVDVGNTPGSDEITEIYAAGAGVDPAEVTKGSWDIPLCIPTDSTPGALVTGPGEAWSHPLESGSLGANMLADDGGLPGTPYAVLFNGADTDVDCGSGATLDDIASGGEITVDCAFRADSIGENDRGSFFTKWASSGNGGYYTHLRAAVDELRVLVECDTTNADAVITAASVGLDTFVDGKVHLLTVHYEDTTKWISIAVDGRWASAYDTRIQGVGNYTSDAAHNFRWGVFNQADVNAFDGVIAWIEMWDNDHHTAGTDFIAPRTVQTPPIANLIETWWADEGTGVAIAARVTSPANDGTITDGIWEAQWDQDSTPLIPQSVTFNGTTTSGVVTDAAAIQDLHAGQFTFEACVGPDSLGEGDNGHILEKIGVTQDNGWVLRISATEGIFARVNCATTDAISEAGSDEFAPDGTWHLVTAQFDGTALPAGNPVIYLWVDGVPIVSYTRQIAAVGAIDSDVGDDLYLGNNAAGDFTFDGRLGGWARLSNVLRYTPNEAFIPNARTNPPALPDVNSVWQIDYSDGAGPTITDDAAGGNNVTLTNYVWNVTPDMEIDAPGARVFHGGYIFGADGAPNDGIKTIITGLTPGDGYVVRAVISQDPDGRANPAIRLYDVTNAAQITQLASPLLTGAHTGGAVATLIVAGARFTQSLIGAMVYNITTGNAAAITAVSGDGTTITAAVAGGWNLNDVFLIQWDNNHLHPWVETFCFTIPSQCTVIQVQVRNLAAEGTVYLHQIEVIESLLINGDHESLTGGNPDLITGWFNQDLDAGDTQAEAVTIHAGAQSVEWNPGATNDERMYTTTVGVTDGDFLTVAAWVYGDGVRGLYYGGFNTAQLSLQNGGSHRILAPLTSSWDEAGAVFRALQNNPLIGFWGFNGAVGDRFTDDAFAFILDPVTLTVTPANQANSLESGGIRIDGLDQAPQIVPVGMISPNAGDVRWQYGPRHGDTEVALFGNATPTIMIVWGDANNYFYVSWGAADTIWVAHNANGAGFQVAAWATGGAYFVPDALHPFRVRWTATRMRLYVDGIVRATINAPTGFVWPDPTTAWWGTSRVGINQVDAVFAAI